MCVCVYNYITHIHTYKHTCLRARFIQCSISKKIYCLSSCFFLFNRKRSIPTWEQQVIDGMAVYSNTGLTFGNKSRVVAVCKKHVTKKNQRQPDIIKST